MGYGNHSLDSLVQRALSRGESAETTALPLHFHARSPISGASLRNPRPLHSNDVVCRRQPLAALAVKLEPVTGMPQFAGELHIHRLGPAGRGGGAWCFAHFRRWERSGDDLYDQWTEAYKTRADDCSE